MRRCEAVWVEVRIGCGRAVKELGNMLANKYFI